MKSVMTLMASGMSITSAMFDIASVAAKNLPGVGAASWTYQGLKLWGGVLGSGATFIGVGWDLYEAAKADRGGYEFLRWAYIVKGAFGAGSGALGVGVTFTYSAPLIGRLTGRAVVGTAVKEVGKRAAAFIGLRILGMAAGGWITVGLLGVQIIIWWVTPNAVEVWLDHSAFGKKRGTGGYKSAEEQEKKLFEALTEMGLQ